VYRDYEATANKCSLGVATMHWDPDPTRLRPRPRRQATQSRTRRTTSKKQRSMESPFGLATVHWDHEPRTAETTRPRCCRHLAGSALLRWVCRQDAGSTLGFMKSSKAARPKDRGPAREPFRAPSSE